MKKRPFTNIIRFEIIIKSLLGVLFSAALCLGQDIKNPQELGAEVVKFSDMRLIQKNKFYFSKEVASQNVAHVQNDLAGYTFKAIAFNEERGIERFTKKSANRYLERDLFSAPEYTATYYYAKYDKSAINIKSTYIQLVSDSHWNRVLYGSLQGVLKSFDDIINPGEIVVNSAGHIFIAERGKSRIVVLRIKGKGQEISLEYVYTIEKLGEITSLAYNDAGSPFDLSDDFLFVADAAANTITRIDIMNNSAIIGSEYKGFKWPVAIAFGRWNGANTNDLYVIDTYEKKLSLYRVNGDDMTLLKEVKASQAQSFSAVELDHFGHVYLSDGVNGEIFKYTANLQLLDSAKGPQNDIIDINIPFGTVNLDGTKYWTGFDQAFVIQKWNEESGVQRYKLGVALKSFNVSLSPNNETLHTIFMLTEFANSRLKIVDAEEKTIYQSDPLTVTSGENMLAWNRMDTKNVQSAPGDYKLKLEIQSVYDESIISREAAFYLPLYYHIDCGAEDATAVIQKISGTANVINGQSVVESKDKVEYKVSDLNPDSEYEIAAQFLNVANEERVQEIWIDGLLLAQPFEVSALLNKTGFIEIPRELFLDAEINIRIERTGAGNVVVDNIWLKEKGREFTFTDPQEMTPTRYQLSQNYPNPFNPSTTISYYLLENSNVLLTVFDVTGREVKILVKMHQNAGQYDVVFDAANLSSGIYFYTLHTDVFRQTRKMVLLK